MKRTQIQRILVASAAIAGLLLVATSGFACRGYGMGYGAGYGMGPATAGTPTLSAAQQKKLDAVHRQYRPQLNTLQQKIKAKYNELASARANDSTTVTRLKTLEGEIFKLESRYRALLGQTNSEIVQAIPSATTRYAPDVYDMGPMMRGGYMGSMMYGPCRGPMMPGGYAGYTPCGW